MPMLPLCHAHAPFVSCPCLSLCHARLPFVMPASHLSFPPPICHSRESGNPESFPHTPRSGEGVGRGAGVIDPSISKLTPAGRVPG